MYTIPVAKNDIILLRWKKTPVRFNSCLGNNCSVVVKVGALISHLNLGFLILLSKHIFWDGEKTLYLKQALKILFDKNPCAQWLSHNKSRFLESVRKTCACHIIHAWGPGTFLDQVFCVAMLRLVTWGQQRGRETPALKSKSEKPEARILGVVFSEISFQKLNRMFYFFK